MEKRKIQAIANKVAKMFCSPQPIVTRQKNTPEGYMGYEIRTELPSYEGGRILQNRIEKAYSGVIVENLGGCVYFAYKP